MLSPIVYTSVGVVVSWSHSVTQSGYFIILPIPALIFVLISLVATHKYNIKVAVLCGIIGALLTTVSMPLPLIYHTPGPILEQTIYPLYYILIIPIIILWVSNFILIKYIKVKQCSRCKNLFNKEELVRCDKCHRKVCPNCLEPKLNICNKCHRKHTMKMELAKKKMELAEKSKPLPAQLPQQQTQQVIIHQAPQIPVPQTPAPETSTNMKNCIHCGALIKPAAKFCDECGKGQ